MGFEVQGPLVDQARYAPPPAAQTAVTQRDYATAARLGVQAVPVRQLDPVNKAAKRDRPGESLAERKAAEDRERYDMLRFAALRRDAAAARRR